MSTLDSVYGSFFHPTQKYSPHHSQSHLPIFSHRAAHHEIQAAKERALGLAWWIVMSNTSGHKLVTIICSQYTSQNHNIYISKVQQRPRPFIFCCFVGGPHIQDLASPSHPPIVTVHQKPTQGPMLLCLPRKSRFLLHASSKVFTPNEQVSRW